MVSAARISAQEVWLVTEQMSEWIFLALEGGVAASASELDKDIAMYTEHDYNHKNQHMYFFSKVHGHVPVIHVNREMLLLLKSWIPMI